MRFIFFFKCIFFPHFPIYVPTLFHDCKSELVRFLKFVPQSSLLGESELRSDLFTGPGRSSRVQEGNIFSSSWGFAKHYQAREEVTSQEVPGLT